MESENTVLNHDSDEEDEYADDPTEPQEPITCCRCNRSCPVDEQMFDCDGCSHFTCVSCRFIDIKCTLCKSTNESSGSSTQVDISSASLEQLHSIYFKRRVVNKAHIVDVEFSVEDGSVLKQKCTICERVFKKSNARYHYTCAVGEKPHKCVECNRTFVKKSHLESHLNNHYGLRPFKCSEPKCKASFAQKDKLIRHMKSHNKETKFMCPLCDKLYTSQDILNHHMIKFHSSTKQYRCNKCPRTYKYPSSLRVHQLKHQSKRDYMCEVCGKKYALSAQLKLHKRSHVNYHRRPFHCRCGKRFMNRRDKARHELIHTSCHDFECSLCNTTFGRKDNLERHMKTFHQDCPLILAKHRKVATIAPFNIRPAVLKKENSILAKKKATKANSNKVVILKELRQVEPKAKSSQNHTKTDNISMGNLKNSEKISKRKCDQKFIKLPSKIIESPTSKICNKESNERESVIISPEKNIPQNRPSVIKSISHLPP